MVIDSPFHVYNLGQDRRASALQAPFAHQNQALKALDRWFSKGASQGDGGIVVLPTGGGKTFTAVRFLCSTAIAKGYKVLWMAHTHHLLDQAYLAFGKSVGTIPASKASLRVRIVSGMPGHDPVHKISPTDDVVVATLQTTTLAYGHPNPALIAWLRSAGDRLCVVFDEAHHAPAASYRKLLKALRADHAEMILIGLTATPTNPNPKKAGWLKELFPHGIIHQSQASALIADGILARPNFERIPTAIVPEIDQAEYERWVESYRDVPESIIEALAKNQTRNALIADHYSRNKSKYGRTIIFAERWYQCEQIASFLKHRGIEAGSIFAKVDGGPATVEGRNVQTSDENHRTLDRFRKGELDVLLNVQMLIEGTDVPETQTVFITRQTTSTIRLTQMVGRALRGPKAGGTEEAYIVSFEDNWAQKINWADFDPLLDGPVEPFEIIHTKRPPAHLISIELIRQLTDQMNSGVDAAPTEFRKLLPVGWYAVEFDAVVEGTENTENFKQLVMVFEDQAEGYQRFLANLARVDLARLGSERSALAAAQDWVDESIGQFFDAPTDELTRVVPKDLFNLARHVAQNDGELPTFHPFEDRQHYDIDTLARQYIKAGAGLALIDAALHQEYDRTDRFWGTLYPQYNLFKSHFDICVGRILNPPNPVVINPIVNPRGGEPSEAEKRRVKQRDGKRCLCCGEDRPRSLQVDHILPRYLGGSNILDNLQTLCKRCNRRKATVEISFLAASCPDHATATDQQWSIDQPKQGLETDLKEWSRWLGRNVNFFYRAAAVEKIRINRTGRYSMEWGISLHDGNAPSSMAALLPGLLGTIRTVLDEAGHSAPEGVRLTTPGQVEASHFVATDPDAPPTELSIIPNGSLCRLEIGGKCQLGLIIGGTLRCSNNRTFDTFAEAYRGLSGLHTNHYWQRWEIHLPNSAEWIRGDIYRKKLARS